MSEFKTAVKTVFSQNEMPLDGEQAELFERYYALMTEKNKVMNLTRITEPSDAALKHFYDSASVLKYVDIEKNALVADIGTGAGFPGIPLKILRPDLQLTLIDSSEKKTAFVRQAAKELGLAVTCLVGRAEDLVRTALRESFGYALSRAVASLPALLELCIPFVKKGGLFIAYKGADYEEELAASANARNILNAEVQHVFLPYAERSHALLTFLKRESTEQKYPRKYALIKSKPL